MTHGHTKKHAHCDHCLHDCGPCDTAYCCKCPKAWANCHTPHYYNWYPYWTTPTYTQPHWAVTSGGSLNVSSTDAIAATEPFARDWNSAEDAVYDHAHAHV